MNDTDSSGIEQCDDCKSPLGDHEQGFCPHEIESGEVGMYSRLTDTYYRVTKWVEQGDGKFIALEKESKDRTQQPDTDRSEGVR